MGFYKYLTRTEIIESSDPFFDEGKIFWILGKLTDTQLKIVREDGARYFLWVNILEYIKLPRRMKEKEACAYLDELQAKADD